MALSPDIQRAIADARAEVAAMSPEDCRGAAALAHRLKPTLPTERQREIAEELAREFGRAAAAARAQPS